MSGVEASYCVGARPKTERFGWVLVRIHPAGVPMINIKSTICALPGLCKYVSLQCYLVVTVIYIQSTHSHLTMYIHIYYMYIYTHIFFTIQSRYSGKILFFFLICDKRECRVQRKNFCVSFWTRVPKFLQPWYMY
jgi:hypothetical protein